MPERHHPRGTVDGSAPQVFARRLHLSGVEAHAHVEAQRSERPLRGDGGLQRRVRRGERRRDPVAERGEHRASALAHRGAEHAEVGVDLVEHGRRRLPLAGRALDVGEQQGHRGAGPTVGAEVHPPIVVVRL